MLRHRGDDGLIAFLDDHPTSCRFGKYRRECTLPAEGSSAAATQLRERARRNRANAMAVGTSRKTADDLTRLQPTAADHEPQRLKPGR